MEFSVVGLPSQNLAYTNCVYVNFNDFMQLLNGVPKGITTKDKIKQYGLNVVINEIVFAARPLKEIEQGFIGMGSLQRQSANCAMNQAAQISVFIPQSKNIVLESVTFELQLLLRGKVTEPKIIDCEQISKQVMSQFTNQVFTTGQVLVVDNAGLTIRLKAIDIKVLEGEGQSQGQLVEGSVPKFSKARDAPIKLTNQASGGTKAVFKADFDFSKLGIGGLDKEFNDIFRRAFASRVFPSHVIKQMGINHVRGMLLFGPPGCGKTLIARKIGQVLNAKEPKVVNGPEILDKFVGESERKIRDLFADARQDQEENGDDSELHIIIFDEIDAVCKSRGSSRDGTGVGDSVVNQLLTQIDGVDSLNNVLVIGMTNRKDMLDEALLRPGRLEVQMEINLPDEKGRGQILKIHTDSSRNHGYLDQRLIANLDSCINMTPLPHDEQNLAQRTKNFSGAEIAGLVRAATAHSLSRGTDLKTFHAVQNYKPEIRVEDFDKALTEVKPKFGSPQDGIGHLYRAGIIKYSKQFLEIEGTIQSLVKNLQDNERTSLSSILLHGEPGVGKTALAASMAIASEFPFVRMVNAADLLGMADSTKCNKIVQTFEEAYRSPASIIIIDDIERVLEYVANGARFSNPVLQTLMVMVKNPPPVPERKVLVIGCTSTYEGIDYLGLGSCFDVSLELPKLCKPSEIKRVLLESSVPIAQNEVDDIVATFDKPVAVKKLLMITEMAREGEVAVTCERFIDCVYKFKL